MLIRALASTTALCVAGSTALAQLQIVQQTRTVSGEVHANAPGGTLQDLYSDSAPDAGPYTANRSVQVTGAWGNSSAGSTQNSVLGDDRFTGTAYAGSSSSVPFGVEGGLAFGSSESELYVTFDVLAPHAYSISGSITRLGQFQNPIVWLAQGTTTVFNFQAQGTIGTTPFQATGVLAPGRYELRVRADGSSYANQFYAQVYSSSLDYVFDVENLAHSAFCFGDGSGTACPCANEAPAGSRVGCRNSLGNGGKLRALGSASLSSDTLVLEGAQMPNSSALYFQGTTAVGGGAGSVFGDGLRCAGGSLKRLATKTNSAGASNYPGPSDPAISVRGAVVAPGDRVYQCWYRNSASFCTVDTFNLTNALSVTWGA